MKRGGSLLFILLSFCSVVFIRPLYAGDAILSWDPPTTNVDETLLTDLAGYKIYYGLHPGNYSNVTDVGNVITWTVTSMAEGNTFYFAVTAYDISGNESGFSNEVSRSILANPPGNIDISTTGSITRVDGYDLLSIELAWGANPSSTNWNPMADLDRNGIIDGKDLDTLMQNFGATQ